MKLWLRRWLLALCAAALMATATLADGTYSLKVSEINGTPVTLGKACCSGRFDAVCTPDVVGASCEFNSECNDPTQPACKPVVCTFGVASHCPIGNSTCQVNVDGNFCSFPTVFGPGDILPGDVIRVDTFLKGWDVARNIGFCLANNAVGSCTISPDSCDVKTVCANTGGDCNSTRNCQQDNTCQGGGGIPCSVDADCADIDCVFGAACVPNNCIVTPLLSSYQWSFDLDSLSSGTAGSIDFATLPCAADSDCRHGETNPLLCTCSSATCELDQTCSDNAVSFIQQSRPDYIFAGQLGGLAIVANNGFILEYTHTFSTGTPVQDFGTERNVGSILMSPSIDAEGVFTLGLTPNGDITNFFDEDNALVPVTDLRPLVIDMGTSGCITPPVSQSWTSIGQHGPGCIFNPACGGVEYGQNIPAGGPFSESRSTGINKIVVAYDIDVDVSNAIVTVDGCDIGGFTQDTSGITMSVVASANPNEAVLMFTPSLPGNNAAIGETPVVYDITLEGVVCAGGVAMAAPETREAWAIFGDANASPITVNNGDLGFVRSARDLILARPPGFQVIDPNSPTAAFEIRADINNDNTVSNADLGLVRTARDNVPQPTGLCP